MAQSLLIISRQAPWSGPGAREALDIVLAGGAFDLPIGLLFLDDGVFQLAPGNKPPPCSKRISAPICRPCRCLVWSRCSPVAPAWRNVASTRPR
ncbi:tRNA 5-methylaminomethyl-2-thiouridine synthase subunit TusC [Pseudomonas chlororaphis subsp. aureofaciens]|nr:tRNA 5-methylaminomethyl-2-thiouridine synthase subunit TusC [Pseudomonas chlororaphis subsp. aureofaciens]